MRVGRNQIQAARRADLYEYLLRYHPDSVKKADHSRLQHVAHDSLIITKGMGWVRNSQSETGNGIDYLMEYHGYTFQRAVAALATFAGEYCDEETCKEIRTTPTYSNTPQEAKKEPFKTPNRIDGRFTRVFAYLSNTRKLDIKIIQHLIDKNLLYEDERHNCVFFSAQSQYAELVGTLSQKRFKGIAAGSDEDGYWMFGATGGKIYVCESAIDAASLFQLRRERAGYASIGGLKPESIKRIQADFPSSEIILAVDADDAGDKFSAKLPDLQRITPTIGKDWNDCI